MFRIAILILLICLQTGFAHSKDIIFWQTYHRPPGVIKKGNDAGNGFIQKTLQLIINEIPEYEHKMPLSSLARSLSDIKSGKNVCHPALIVTKERAKYMYFSEASLVNPTNRIIAKQGRFDSQMSANGIDLKKLLQEENLTLSLVKQRSYGSVIDNALDNYLHAHNVFQMSNTDLSGVFKMLELDRVDFTIAYPFELKYYLLNSSINKQQELVPYPIDGELMYNMGSVACPKNKWGKQIISKVNAALKKLKPTKEYKFAITTWWESARGTIPFEKFYREEFLTH